MTLPENLGTEEQKIYCGDCLELLKEIPDESVDLVVTDPPYGVSYAQKNEFLNSIDKGNHIQEEIENDSQTIPEMFEFWRSFLTLTYQKTKPGGAYYVFAPQGGELMMMMMAIRDSGWHLKHTLIWAKQHFVLGRCDYHYQHEPILYGWKEGSHRFFGSKGESSLWFCDRPMASKLHPTQKPLNLMLRAIQNSSAEGDLILDPFLGSGTTLVACKMLGRKGIGIEISPEYCQIARKRLLAVPEKLEAFGEWES